MFSGRTASVLVTKTGPVQGMFPHYLDASFALTFVLEIDLNERELREAHQYATVTLQSGA